MLCGEPNVNRVPIPLAAVMILLLAGATAPSQDPPAREKKIPLYCPVAGMPEAKTCCCPGTPMTYHWRYHCNYVPEPWITVEYKGAVVQLCCWRCEKIFKETPAKFAAVAHHQLAATKQARQVKCPLTGKAYVPAIFTEVAGVRVFFASAEGRKNVAAMKEFERVNLVFGEPAFARGFVVPTGRVFCPVAGPGLCSYFPPLEGRPELAVEYKGAVVQVCCDACKEMFKKTPEPYAAFAHHQLAATRQARQVRCPLTGKAFDVTIFTEVAGVRVFFASEEGQKKVAALSEVERFCLVFGESAFAQGFVVATKQNAIAVIEKAGGRVRLDPNIANGPVTVDLANSKVSDAELAYLTGLPNLCVLYLQGTRITDEGLRHLKKLTDLQELHLTGTPITDAGLDELKGLGSLRVLAINNTQISDEWFKSVQEMTQLQELSLGGRKLTRARLERLRGLKDLQSLHLYADQVGDANLMHIGEFTNLRVLYLQGSNFTDAGLEHLKGLTKLRELHLAANGWAGRLPITDAGLEHLQSLTNLEALDITRTQVTYAGVSRLQQALPNLKIEGNRKQIAPPNLD